MKKKCKQKRYLLPLKSRCFLSLSQFRKHKPNTKRRRECDRGREKRKVVEMMSLTVWRRARRNRRRLVT